MNVRTGMSNKNIWIGYLDAGSKSSPVLIDQGLDTGNQKTQYIFNLNRGEVIEYNRDVVGTKLRELLPEENGYIKELKAVYNKVQKEFTPRTRRSRAISESTPTSPTVNYTDYDDEDIDIDVDSDDLDIDEED